jgi:hypothetical protein
MSQCYICTGCIGRAVISFLSTEIMISVRQVHGDENTHDCDFCKDGIIPNKAVYVLVF